MEIVHPLIQAANKDNIEDFLRIVFPEQWQPIASRIIETGVEYGASDCPWAPRWSPIPLTAKKGRNDLEAAVKSCLYRAHDCIHQLWGLPIPSSELNEHDFYLFKRAQMCGEVAVLTLIEFCLAKNLYDTYPDARPYILKRCAVNMLSTTLKYKTTEEIAIRLDDVLHKQRRPKWLRDDIESTKFADYYVPMLEEDRNGVDRNWAVMKKHNWIPYGTPNTRYCPVMDGLELTRWMINDFFSLMSTDAVIDVELACFNRQRRMRHLFLLAK